MEKNNVRIKSKVGHRLLSYLEVTSGDVGHVHVVGGWADVLVLLLGEDVEGDQVDLGVAVLAGLGGGHLHNLARATLK